LSDYTGWVTAIEGWVTGVIPAALLLSGYWKHTTEIAIALGAFGVVVFAALWPLTRKSRQPAPAESAGSTGTTS